MTPAENKRLAEAVRDACLKGEPHSGERRYREVPAGLPVEQDAEREALAEKVRQACFKAADEAYKDAATSGLCHEGALEASLGAIKMLDLNTVLAGVEPSKKPG